MSDTPTLEMHHEATRALLAAWIGTFHARSHDWRANKLDHQAPTQPGRLSIDALIEEASALSGHAGNAAFHQAMARLRADIVALASVRE
jgi:hypothetical protein